MSDVQGGVRGRVCGSAESRLIDASKAISPAVHTTERIHMLMASRSAAFLPRHPFLSSLRRLGTDGSFWTVPGRPTGLMSFESETPIYNTGSWICDCACRKEHILRRTEDVLKISTCLSVWTCILIRHLFTTIFQSEFLNKLKQDITRAIVKMVRAGLQFHQSTSPQ